MKILMLGWEFPPAKSGGLGTHCFELVNQLNLKGVQVIFVTPKASKIINYSFKNIIIKQINVKLDNPYADGNSKISEDRYDWNFLKEVEIFNKKCVSQVMDEKFDLIHCHDWMTVLAGIELKKLTEKKLIFTIHSTEYDRTINFNPFKEIVRIEKKGLDWADEIITVSKYMKKQLIKKYQVRKEKISVIYNGIDNSKFVGLTKKNLNKIVLFLGRLVNQKGPNTFLLVASKVLEKDPNVLFILAGQGEKLGELVEEAIRLRIMNNVLFTGYLTEKELVLAYEMADVYVMPSVTEPFGITALEAIASGTPVVVSKNAGVTEKINNCLKVDFWDIFGIADKILGLIRYPVLSDVIRKNAFEELYSLNWRNITEKTIELYRRS